jgi:hypothetical protein
MEKVLKLYTYVDGGINDTPFPDSDNQIELGEFRYDAKRMGGAPTISASVDYPTCLDDVWTDMVYTKLNGERYFLKQTPTSSLSNEDARYKHTLEFVAERTILDNAYFYDAVVGKPLENDKPVTNSTKFHFYGNVEEFVRKLNHSLQYTSLQEIDEEGNVLSGYHVVLDEDIVTRDDKQISFDGVVFSQALQECYNQFGIPYYFDGKTIHVGFTNNVISDVLEYGVDGALLSATKTNANFKVVNRATGYGSTDNIPYYYPNNAPKGEIKISTTGSITPEDVEILDADRFNQLRAGDTYTFKGDITANEEQLSVVLPSITQQIPFIDGEATVKKLYIENDSVDVNIRYDFTFDAAAESNIELSWQLANCANPSFNMTPPLKAAFGKDHLELEVKRVVFSDDEESYEIPFEPTTIKHTYYSDIVYRSGQTSTGTVASKLIQTGITFSTPNIHGGASVVIEAKLKTLGKNFWSQVPDYYWGEGNTKKPYSDIVFTAYVDTHVTGSWRDANDEIVNMKYYGVKFLKNPQYGDTLRHDIVKYVNTSTNLQPSIYRATDGKERFYNAINYPFAYVEGYELKYGEYVKDGEVHNDAYIDDKGNYYEFTNEYKEGRPREHVFSVEDIKPTIKEATNDISWMEEDEEGEMKQVFQRIDMFSEFAYNIGDNDETYIDPNGNTSYKHPYFFGKLRKMDFNLFDHAIENGAMTISMTSGHAGACNFEIGVSKEEPQFNPVQVYEQDEVIDGVLHKKGSLKYDKNGYVRCGLEDWQDVEWPQDVQQDTVNNEVWIALKKEDSTYGILMPKAPRYEEGELVSAGHRPVACSSAESNDGDTFVILNINLPEEYIYKAEKKLEKAIVKYIWENNVEKFNFSVNFSRIFLEENQDILRSLNENARLTRVKYNGNEYILYVSSYSYSMNSGDVLPEIRIELDDTLTISQNALQEAINEVKSDIADAINAMDVAAIGSRYFLRKDTYDVAEAPIDFRGGVYFGEGGDVSYYEDGSAKLTIDYLEVTKKATFTSLEIQEKTHAGGQILLTPAAMICNKVEETEDAYRCYFQNVGENGEEIYNQFIEGDQAISQTFNEWGGHYYWRLVTAVGEDYVDLSKTDCTPESDIPKVGDKIIQLGHRNLEDRQNAIVIAAYGDDSPYIIQYKGINAFELTDDKIVTKLSSTENIFTGKVHMELGSDGLDTLPEWIEVKETAEEALERVEAMGENTFAQLQEEIEKVKEESKEYTDNAKLEINTKISEVEQAKADIEDVYDKVTADGKISAAEQKAVASANAYANAQSDYLDRTLRAWADGEIDDAEARAIAEAEAKVNAAKEEMEQYTEDMVNGIEIGGENLLRNSGFTGDYLSERLADDSVLGSAAELYSPPFDHWETNVDTSRVELPNESVSGYGVDLGGTSILQTLYYNITIGESYVVSFKAKTESNATIDVSFGGVSSLTQISSEWESYSIVIEANTNNNTFSIAGNAIVCDLKLEKGNKSTSWSASPLDNRSDRAYYQSMKYIQNAFEGATDVLGGLVLTEQIQVGDYDAENKEWVKMNGGMSGIYESNNDVAFWAGGDFEQAVETSMKYEDDPAYQPTEEELAAMANFVVTHGGRAILNEAIVRGSVYANEGNFGQGCTIGDTVRVVDGGIEIDSHVNDIEGEIHIDESNGITCSNTKFYASLGGSGCGNSMLSVGTVSSGGACPNNPTPIIVSGDTDAIYCYRGSFAGLRPKCCHIDELYYNGGYYLKDDIFSVLFPSSGTYNLNLDNLFVGNLNHPEYGQEIWFETMGADINVTSTIPMWAHHAAQYQTSHTFSSSGVIRFKYYGAFNGQPNGIWTYSWVETK